VTVSGADDVKLGTAFTKLRGMSATDWERLPDFIRNIQVGKFDEEIPIELLKRVWLQRNRGRSMRSKA
jgi:hypothetical protein